MAETEEIITKRLHISGLTPAIRPADLSQKLGSFGTVKALDGFDKIDGLGQPRKFGYITLETTQAKLAKCMNLLSGVTWKGAKLRIGEAKPDFHERIARENAPDDVGEDGEPPRKKRRLPRGVQGVHAADMSPVTPENVEGRGGWRVTPLGRIVRPIRMRPEHPLPEQLPPPPKPKDKKSTYKKSSKRVKVPPVRARRRTIDPTKWGSQHLKGIFLEGGDGIAAQYQKRVMLHEESEAENESESDESGSESYHEVEVEEEEIEEQVLEGAEPIQVHSQLAAPVERLASPAPAPPTVQSSTKISAATPEPDIIQEKNAALGLLQSMFGDRDEWGGEESLDSDVDMDAVAKSTTRIPATQTNAQDDFEEVPMAVEPRVPSPSATSSASSSPEPEENAPPPSGPVAQKQATLKDLFAPREEEGGFSLLGHLDLDIDLDDDVLNASFANSQAPPPPSAPPTTLPATTLWSTRTKAQIKFDPTLPLFFPLPQDERSGFRSKVKDPYDVARENGWDWHNFCRTETSEEIRQRWEAQKVDLTQDWKRRHREAIKSRRRRGGGDGD